jgi:hypothetical protein
MSLKPERLEAKKLFVENLLSVESILKVLSVKVSKKTLHNWKNNADGKDDATWDSLRAKKFSEHKDIKDGLKEVIKATINQLKSDPANAMLHFALSKYLTSFRYYGDFENLFKEIEGDEKDKSATPADTNEMMRKIVEGVDSYLRGKT